MKRIGTGRRGALVAAVTVATLGLAGSVAYATIPGPGGVIQGCYDSGGNVKVVDALPCPRGYAPLQWNQQGPKGADGLNGVDGVSVTSTALGQGDANCREGGSKFTVANGDTYACNGEQGPAGTPGTPGGDGSDAASTLTGRVDGALIFDDPTTPPTELPRYAEPSGGSEHVHVLDESMRTHLSPSATIVARDLAVKALMSGSGDTATFTLRDDGVDTPVSCTITVNSPSSNVVQTCDSGASTATILPGSELSLEITVNGTTLVKPSILFAWRATTP